MNINKVFGIGLSKTGIMSLNKALEILRYSSRPYPQDLNIFDKIDAGTDITVASEYKYLDEKYPSSKFILTIRDCGTWLPSIIKHHKRRPPHKMREFVLVTRKKVWGSIDPTEKQMVIAYEKHLSDVKSHFSSRPNDLLVLNIINGEGWEKLCPFLNKKILNENFPWENKTP